MHVAWTNFLQDVPKRMQLDYYYLSLISIVEGIQKGGKKNTIVPNLIVSQDIPILYALKIPDLWGIMQSADFFVVVGILLFLWV